MNDGRGAESNAALFQQKATDLQSFLGHLRNELTRLRAYFGRK